MITSAKTKWVEKHAWLPVGGLAILVSGLYVAYAYSHGQLGFPLDDAWIHQTYARNLAQSGQLAYLPDQPSAGSTSPAWSLLLSVGYLLGLDYRAWTYLLGALSLTTAALLALRLLRQLLSLWPHTGRAWEPWVTVSAGLLCAAEWHLVWASVSGMETMLFVCLSLALLGYYLAQIASRRAADGPATLQRERDVVRAVGIGLLGGILTLTRPEGLGLACLVIAGLLALPWDRSELRSRLLETGASLLALAAILVPYVLFNLDTAGAPFPNTFYAKQVEYQTLAHDVGLPVRFWRVLWPTLVGAQLLLLPGFCYAACRLARQRRWPAFLPLVWWLALLLVYALRLPVSYQHGRYAMPSIPVLLVYGVWGTADLLHLHSRHIVLRALSKAAPPAIALLAVLFLGRGATAYLDDVGFVEGEMVAAAHWLNQHTGPGDLIAVHDIGAVGYLTDRPLLDLAGLISPEVIPFVNDAKQLAEWMSQRGATWAVFFPDFSPVYAQLATDPRFRQVYCTDYDWTQSMGHQNLCVYGLKRSKQP